MSGPIFPLRPIDLQAPGWLSAAVEDLTQTYYWSDCWDPDFYVALARAGFISTSMAFADPPWLLLPELQESYAVLDWANLKVDRWVAPLLAGPVARGGVELRLVNELDPVLDAVGEYHQPSWLSPPYRDLLSRLQRRVQTDFRPVAVELREPETNLLIAGEVGYFIGATYTSLTGFFRRQDKRWANYGKLQLVLLARWLEQNGVAFWNLGHPNMAYKTALGARILPRAEFLARWNGAT